jgi:hypothetical protein
MRGEPVPGVGREGGWFQIGEVSRIGENGGVVRAALRPKRSPS